MKKTNRPTRIDVFYHTPKAIGSKTTNSQIAGDIKDILAIATGKNWEPLKRSGRFINANYPPDDVSQEELEEFWGKPKKEDRQILDNIKVDYGRKRNQKGKERWRSASHYRRKLQ